MSVRSIARKIIPIGARQMLRGALTPKAVPPATADWDEVFEDDIYLASYPRSGNTWLRNVLTNLRFPDARWDLHSLGVAFPEYGSKIDIAAVPRSRWIKTHLGYSSAYKNVVYLIRDGRDTAVSFYRWSGAAMPFDDFVRKHVLMPSGAFLAWHIHVMDWTVKMPPGSLFIRYEDFIGADAMGEFQRLAKFLGLERTDAEIQVALEKSTYHKQQKDFDNHPLLAGRAVGVGAGAGGWREYFSDELHDEFWAAAGGVMALGNYRRD